MFPYRAKDDTQVCTVQAEDSSVRLTFGLCEEKAGTLTDCAMTAQCGTDTYWLDRRSNFKDVGYNHVDRTLMSESVEDLKRGYDQ
jgi:hypothetical protein